MGTTMCIILHTNELILIVTPGGNTITSVPLLQVRKPRPEIPGPVSKWQGCCRNTMVGSLESLLQAASNLGAVWCSCLPGRGQTLYRLGECGQTLGTSPPHPYCSPNGFSEYFSLTQVMFVPNDTCEGSRIGRPKMCPFVTWTVLSYRTSRSRRVQKSFYLSRNYLKEFR